jgi:hypothetical protein
MYIRGIHFSPIGGWPRSSPFGQNGSTSAIKAGQSVTASISAGNRSRRVVFFFDAYSNSEKLDCIVDFLSILIHLILASYRFLQASNIEMNQRSP